MGGSGSGEKAGETLICAVSGSGEILPQDNQIGKGGPLWRRKAEIPSTNTSVKDRAAIHPGHQSRASFGLSRNSRMLLQKFPWNMGPSLSPGLHSNARFTLRGGECLRLWWQSIWQQDEYQACAAEHSPHGVSGSWQAKLECRHVWPVCGQLLSTLTQFLCLYHPKEQSKHRPNDYFICSCIFQSQKFMRTWQVLRDAGKTGAPSVKGAAWRRRGGTVDPKQCRNSRIMGVEIRTQ